MPSPIEFPPLHTLTAEEQDAIIAAQRANRPLPQTIGKAKSKAKPKKSLSITLEDLRLLFPALSEEDLAALLIGTPPHPDDEASNPPVDAPDPSDEDEEDEDDEDDEES